MVENEKIGRYRLDGRLGAGSFATVWLGYDPELDVAVAIKVLAENWSHNLDVRERFLAEARLLRRVRDQRIIRVHDIGTLPDDQPYFVMDYADGGTVAQLITDRRPSPDGSLRLGAEIARAVQVLHEHGVAHRDIKPGNLLLTSQVGRDDHVVVVADLGMAKSLAEASGYTVTAGTPAYMAPEQALGLGFDHRADVYAIAAVTYALLSGHPPFGGKGLTEGAELDRTKRLASLGPDFEAVDAVLAAALSGDPENRPASAGILALQLDGLVGGGGAIVQNTSESHDDEDTVAAATRRPAGTATPVLETEERSPSRSTGLNPVTVAMSALVVGVLVALLTWLLLTMLA